VRSSEVKNGSLQASDMSPTARRALAGRPGPMGPPGPPGPAAVSLFAAVDAAGRLVRGNATSGGRTSGPGVYEVGFGRPVSGCVFSATLGTTDGSGTTPGRVVVREAGPRVCVSTFDAGGTPADLPVHLVVAG